MIGNLLRRVALVAVCVPAAWLVACGGGTTEGALTPTRLVSFGDAFSDIGNSGTASKYTVNDATVNTWVEQVASGYTLTITPSATGGLGYARGNARIVAKPDAAGQASTLTVTEQIDAFLSAHKPELNDLMLINGGVSDIVTQVSAVIAGTTTEADMVIRVKQAGADMGGQVRRLIQQGAKHVLVAGVNNLGHTPWAKRVGKEAVLTDASIRFNEALLLAIVDLGNQVLYVDLYNYAGAVVTTPAAFGLTDATTPVCTSLDSGSGIGTGIGQVNSALCSDTTVVAGAEVDKKYNSYVFADGLYFTPTMNRLFGSNAFSRVRARF
ncbi:SGNH/GDSL hydrolase family protein [Rhodoferax sp.]|uniref:SGNH/GDSL hydrolase family protein n=1 Tax=Rhodoferax sp. TaxID=50421 RepID=UPI0027524B74|nr:SGNH/GDSL hydrolase family protein [Rhodoferax sp.]